MCWHRLLVGVMASGTCREGSCRRHACHIVISPVSIKRPEKPLCRSRAVGHEDWQIREVERKDCQCVVTSSFCNLQFPIVRNCIGVMDDLDDESPKNRYVAPS